MRYMAEDGEIFTVKQECVKYDNKIKKERLKEVADTYRKLETLYLKYIEDYSHAILICLTDEENSVSDEDILSFLEKGYLEYED